MNLPSSVIPILLDNKVVECYELVIMTLEVGNMKFPIACEGSIK